MYHVSDCLKDKVGMQGSRLMDAEEATSTGGGGSTRERRMALQQDVSLHVHLINHVQILSRYYQFHRY